MTDELRGATRKLAQAAGRPVIYLSSSHVRKECRAREIAERDGIQEGLIAVLTCIEPCFTWQVRKQAGTQRLVLEQVEKKCLFQYFFFQHAQFGLMHVRMQTWIPFTSRPEFLLQGFRNQDLRVLLFANDQTKTAKQQAGKVTRLIRLLRAHGLIRKVRQSHRYQISATGRVQITAILAAQQATTQQLTQLAL